MNTPEGKHHRTPETDATVRLSPTRLIAILNQKGGVGKTMLTLSLASHIAANNGRVLVVDVDPQANAFDLTSLMDDPGYDVIHELNPAELTRIRQLRSYDTILVDSPGSLEGMDVLDEILRRASYSLIPYDHQPESVAPTLRTVQKVRASGVPFKVVVTKADPRRGGAALMDAWQTLDDAGIAHCRSAVRTYQAWPNSLTARVPIARWHDRNAANLREDVAGVHTEMLLDIDRVSVPAGSA